MMGAFMTGLDWLSRSKECLSLKLVKRHFVISKKKQHNVIRIKDFLNSDTGSNPET